MKFVPTKASHKIKLFYADKNASKPGSEEKPGARAGQLVATVHLLDDDGDEGASTHYTRDFLSEKEHSELDRLIKKIQDGVLALRPSGRE